MEARTPRRRSPDCLQRCDGDCDAFQCACSIEGVRRETDRAHHGQSRISCEVFPRRHMARKRRRVSRFGAVRLRGRQRHREVPDRDRRKGDSGCCGSPDSIWRENAFGRRRVPYVTRRTPGSGVHKLKNGVAPEHAWGLLGTRPDQRCIAQARRRRSRFEPDVCQVLTGQQQGWLCSRERHLCGRSGKQENYTADAGRF